MTSSFVDPGFDPGLDPGFGPGVDPGFVAFSGAAGIIGTLVALGFVAAIVIGVYRMVIAHRASEKLGLGPTGTFLAVTDESAPTAFLAGAAVKDAVERSGPATSTADSPTVVDERADVASRLRSLTAARDEGLVSDEEFARLRTQILAEA